MPGRTPRFLLLIVGAFALSAIAWLRCAPPYAIEIAPAYAMGEVSPAILAVQAGGDPIAARGETMAHEVPGYDEIVLQEHLGRAFVTAMDGRIWRLDLASGRAEPFVDPPLMAAGARAVPGRDDLVWFCASRLHGATYPASEQVGLYELEISTRTVRPLLLRVPTPPPRQPPRAGRLGTLYAPDERPRLGAAALDEANSRPIAFCNDLDVSRDGQRIYWSEPFDGPGASMGGGAFYEGIGLGRNGRLWLHDLARGEVSLVAQGYTFLDGVLLEHAGEGDETSLLVTETPKFRVLRFELGSDRDEEVWHGLPGMPDGLDRDADGRVWIGLLKERSPAVTWIHANPWLKSLLLRVPRAWLPEPHRTGVLALSPDARTPLYFAMHDGSRAAEISVAVPGRERVFLPSFSPHTPGVHSLPSPFAPPP